MGRRRVNHAQYREFKNRVKVSPRWGEFVERRETLKAEGRGIAEVEEILMREFGEGAEEEASEEDAEAVEEEGEEKGSKKAGGQKAGKKGGAKGAGPMKFRKKDFEGKERCSPLEAVIWVLDHMDYSDVTVKDAPSAMAWSLWCDAQKPLMRAKLWGMLEKLLPSKRELEIENRFEDDGRNVEQTIHRVLRALEQEGSDDDALLPPGPEDTGGEPEVAGEGTQRGIPESDDGR